MKPTYNGFGDGYRSYETSPHGEQQIWEWRYDYSAPQLFSISTNMGQSFTGVTRDDAAKLAALIFKDETIMQICLNPAPAKGDWHLVETIPAQPPEPAVSLPSDAKAG